MLRFLKEILFHTSNVLIWGLILAILFVVLISVIIIFPGLRELWNHAYGSTAFVNAVNSDGLKYLSLYLSSFVVSTAAFIALLTYIRERKSN